MAEIKARLSSATNVSARLSPRKNLVTTNLSLGRAEDLAFTEGVLETVTTVADQILDQFLKTDLRGAKYVIQATSGTDTHFLEMTLIHDGTDTYFSEYGLLQTNGDLFTLSTNINDADFVQVLVTPLFEDVRFTFTRIEVQI